MAANTSTEAECSGLDGYVSFYGLDGLFLSMATGSLCRNAPVLFESERFRLVASDADREAIMLETTIDGRQEYLGLRPNSCTFGPVLTAAEAFVFQLEPTQRTTVKLRVVGGLGYLAAPTLTSPATVNESGTELVMIRNAPLGVITGKCALGHMDGRKIALSTGLQQGWLSTPSGGSPAKLTNGSHLIGNREIFTLAVVESTTNSLALVADHDAWLSAYSDGSVRAESKIAHEWDTFTLVPVDATARPAVGLRTAHGTFLRGNSNSDLDASAVSCNSPTERFFIYDARAAQRLYGRSPPTTQASIFRPVAAAIKGAATSVQGLVASLLPRTTAAAGAAPLPTSSSLSTHSVISTALRNNDLQALRAAIAAKPLAVTEMSLMTGYTVLHTSIETSSPEVVSYIVQLPGLDINATTAEGWSTGMYTALHLAVKHRRHDLISILVQAGCDPSATCQNGLTALGMAALNNDAACTRQLVDAGVAPSLGSRTCTALELAVWVGALRSMAALLPATSRLDVQRSFGSALDALVDPTSEAEAHSYLGFSGDLSAIGTSASIYAGDIDIKWAILVFLTEKAISLNYAKEHAERLHQKADVFAQNAARLETQFQLRVGPGRKRDVRQALAHGLAVAGVVAVSSAVGAFGIAFSSLISYAGGDCAAEADQAELRRLYCLITMERRCEKRCNDMANILLQYANATDTSTSYNTT